MTGPRLGAVGRKVDVGDLVGAAEIADRLGMGHRESVHVLRRRHPDFPEPVAHLRTALVWAWPDVRRWVLRTGIPKRGAELLRAEKGGRK